jgi:hypothetical protein
MVHTQIEDTKGTMGLRELKCTRLKIFGQQQPPDTQYQCHRLTRASPPLPQVTSTGTSKRRPELEPRR